MDWPVSRWSVSAIEMLRQSPSQRFDGFSLTGESPLFSAKHSQIAPVWRK